MENYSTFIFIITNAGWNENCPKERQRIWCGLWGVHWSGRSISGSTSVCLKFKILQTNKKIGSEHFRISIHLWAKLIFWWKNLCRSIQSIPTTKRATKKSSFLKTFRMRRLSACGNINNDQKIYARTCEFFLAAKKCTFKNAYFLSVTDYAEEFSENRIENWEKRAFKSK